MTTFTTEDRIIAEKDGSYTVNVNGGEITMSTRNVGMVSKMNNEPVAWIAVGDNTSVFFDLDCALSIDDNPTPLYTHPVKELTDEEIYDVFEGCLFDGVFNKYEFARAILRKAQEK